jgi:hypothetical protein
MTMLLLIKAPYAKKLETKSLLLDWQNPSQPLSHQILAPIGFWLFPKLTSAMTGQRY